ncbi:MAG: IS630 family transposase [Bryobacteraceae bacterium]
MPFHAEPVSLSAEEQTELEAMSRSRTLPATDVSKAKMILWLAQGRTYREIEKGLDTTAPTIARWKARFLKDRIDGLVAERHPGQTPSVRTPRLQAKILTAIKNGPRDGSTHWSCRKLAKQFGVSKDSVQRILVQANVKPHRLERYMASNDPDFETKAADIIGLYLNPPQHAAVFCVDEKTAIQALDRLDPVLPLSPGRLERHGFEYYRHGTLSLFAALDVQTGKVQGKTAARHTSAEFVEFLEQIVGGCRPQQEIHVILDNLSAHKTKTVAAFLEQHPNVRLHFTPTYSSWLNQVEIWFARLEREVIARGVFHSVADLARKLMRFIRAYSKVARPIKWKYNDPSRRIAC